MSFLSSELSHGFRSRTRMRGIFLLGFLALTGAAPGFGHAQTSSPIDLPSRVEQLERQVDTLSQEVQQLKSQRAVSTNTLAAPIGLQSPDDTSRQPGWLRHISIGGFGETVYTHFARTQQNGAAAGQNDVADLNRAVLEVEYHYNDWIMLDSEMEIEHAGTGQGAESRGELSMEEAYVDFKMADPLHIQTGLFYMPMGLTNQQNEPTDFHGVFRPGTETFILPTDWSELGAGLTGDWGPFSYESDAVTGLQAVKTPSADGFSGGTGLREGRSEGSRSLAESVAWVSRLDLHPTNGVMVGGAYYIGEADQDLAPRVPLSLWEGHARAEWQGAELRVLYAEGTIGGAGSLNTAQATAGADGFTPAGKNYVGRKLFGGYVEPAFNLLFLRAGSKQYLAPFFRYERYDTQSQVPAGFTNNPANSHTDYTLGLTYKPISQVVLTGDYQWLRNEAQTGVNQLNLGVGYTF